MKIYVVGDSISVHYRPYLKSYLCDSLSHSSKEDEKAALTDLDKPQGTNTGDSSMLLAFLKDKTKLESIDADVFFFNCGLHDIKTDPLTGAKQIPLPQYRENLKAILAVQATMKPRLVWIRITPCDEAVHNNPTSTFLRFSNDVIAYNQVADEVMAKAGVPSVDLYTFTLNLGTDLYCDHVHFHEHIREKQAAFIAGWLAAYKELRINQHEERKH